MSIGVVAAKLAAAFATDGNFRKTAGWVLVAVLSPIIVLVVLILSMGAANATHNQSVAEVCFNGGAIPDSTPAEYREYIEDMRVSFSLIDTAIENMVSETDGGDVPDAVRIKAVFFSLYFGDDAPSRRAHRSFADCFVTYEEHTRTVTSTDADGNETEEEETYYILVPITDMATVYANIESAMGISVTDEQIANADSVYNLIKYGAANPGGSSAFEGADVPYIGADGFCSPIGANWRSVVTSEFGTRRDPITGRTKTHSGIDLGIPKGTAVRAALPGTVTIAEYNPGGYGWYVLIDHGNGLATLYAHNSSLRVRAGQIVNAGDIVSVSGSTGRSTGPHLHFEVRVNGNKVNPGSYLP